MSWLVTGGAGYIGSHILRAFHRAGMDVVALDSLTSGHREFVPGTTPFVHADILDTDTVVQTLRDHDVSGVIHLAGYKYAGESVKNPLLTYEQNVTGTAHLLTAMERAGVPNMVFSSSAAVYGTPHVDLVTETTPTVPESPYGESKLVGEWLIRDQGRARGLQHTSLRYFNVVGSATPQLYDTRIGCGPETENLRHGLRHPGWHLHPRLRPRRRPRRGARGRGPGPRDRSDPGTGLQPWLGHGRLRARDHGDHSPRGRHRLRTRIVRPPPGGPGPDRRRRDTGRPRPRLENAPQPARHGGQRLHSTPVSPPQNPYTITCTEVARPRRPRYTGFWSVSPSWVS